mgnify:CR=1 FL=1
MSTSNADMGGGEGVVEASAARAISAKTPDNGLWDSRVDPESFADKGMARENAGSTSQPGDPAEVEAVEAVEAVAVSAVATVSAVSAVSAVLAVLAATAWRSEGASQERILGVPSRGTRLEAASQSTGSPGNTNGRALAPSAGSMQRAALDSRGHSWMAASSRARRGGYRTFWKSRSSQISQIRESPSNL